jgi:hypothetical protein
MYEAIERGDEVAAAEGFAEDAVFHSQLRGRDFTGRDQILAETLKQVEELKSRFKVHDICASDGHVVALLETSREVNGVRTTHRLVHVLHLDDDGKVAECWAISPPQS